MNSIDGVHYGNQWVGLGLNRDFFYEDERGCLGANVRTLGNKVCHLGKVGFSHGFKLKDHSTRWMYFSFLLTQQKLRNFFVRD